MCFLCFTVTENVMICFALNHLPPHPLHAEASYDVLPWINRITSDPKLIIQRVSYLLDSTIPIKWWCLVSFHQLIVNLLQKKYEADWVIGWNGLGSLFIKYWHFIYWNQWTDWGMTKSFSVKLIALIYNSF